MVTADVLSSARFWNMKYPARIFRTIRSTDIYLKFIHITDFKENYVALCKKLLNNCKSKDFIWDYAGGLLCRRKLCGGQDPKNFGLVGIPFCHPIALGFNDKKRTPEKQGAHD